MGALNQTDERLFSSVHKILKIGVTLPVTTASAERSFSTLKRLKTYLRNSTGDTRLTGLALMIIHRIFGFDVTKILDDFAQKNKNIE